MVGFYSANRQFDWLELSLVYNKSNKHLTVYNSYNVEHTAKKVKNATSENFTEAYSLANEKTYDVNNNIQKHVLFKQFVAWSCDRCSVAPLTDYINNPI